MADENDSMTALDEALGLTPEATAAADAAAGAPAQEETETETGEGAEQDAAGEGAEQEGGEEGAAKSEGEEGAELTPEQKAEAEKKAAEEAAAKKPDYLNDPVPKELAVETQKRMRFLIKTAKEAGAAAERVQGEFKTVIDAIQQTGTNPDQYRETLSWLALFNSGDPRQQMQALDLVESVAERLATLLGVERRSNDPLAGHADLQQSVQKGEITPAYAKQIAISRNSGKLRTELQGAAQQDFRQHQTQQQTLDQARAGLNQLEAQLRASDPNFAAKRAIVVEALKPAFKHISPDKWVQAFSDAYARVRLPTAAAGGAGSRGNGVPKNQPLRAGSPAGGQAKPPASGLDALESALANMG
ncbi:MAG: hypothetical protein KGL39_09500 [Patescibacteria group bacterium]|nr:hypothetical protein [Patescibacteria group bacterium]